MPPMDPLNSRTAITAERPTSMPSTSKAPDWPCMKQTGSLRLRVMKISPKQIVSTTVLMFCILTPFKAPGQQAHPTENKRAVAVLDRNQASAIMPGAVFFRGQSASIQARNSAGLRLPNGKLVLVALVDTSGYSSAIQQAYQGYLFTELPLKIDGQNLPPGAYGFGFLQDNKIVVMDIGGNEVLHGTTRRDEALARPTPLQIISDSTDGPRLYLGRNYVVLSAAEN